MKKTNNIRLVLITAALASCNRETVPIQSAHNLYSDSTLNEALEGGNSGFRDAIPYCMAIPQIWNYPFGAFCYYYGCPHVLTHYQPGREYRKGVAWRRGHIIVRGGWGNSGVSKSVNS